MGYGEFVCVFGCLFVSLGAKVRIVLCWCKAVGLQNEADGRGGGANVQMCECANVSLRECANVSLRECANVRMCKCANEGCLVRDVCPLWGRRLNRRALHGLMAPLMGATIESSRSTRLPGGALRAQAYGGEVSRLRMDEEVFYGWFVKMQAPCRARRFKRRLHGACKGRASEVGRLRPMRLRPHVLPSCLLQTKAKNFWPAQQFGWAETADKLHASFL